MENGHLISRICSAQNGLQEQCQELIYLRKILSANKIGDTTYKTINKIKKYSGLPGKYYKKATQIEKIFTPDSSGYDKFKNTMKYIGGTDFNISSPVGDFNDTVLEIIDTVIDIAA